MEGKVLEQEMAKQAIGKILDVGDVRYWIKRFQELRGRSHREQLLVNRAFLKACDERKGGE